MKKICFLACCVLILSCLRPPICVAATQVDEFPKAGVIYGMHSEDEGGYKASFSLALNKVEADGTSPRTFAPAYSNTLDSDILYGVMFEKTTDGYYKILPLSMPGGWCLQPGKGYAEEIIISVGVFKNKPEQLWELTPMDGGYRISNLAYPEKVLGVGRSAFNLMDADKAKPIYIEERIVEFPETHIYVKGPAGWHPGVYLYPIYEAKDNKWNGIAVMEKNENGWFSFYSPLREEYQIINYARTAMGAQTIFHDEIFTLSEMELNKDYWIVISDDPEVEGDLTFNVYDYNPDGPYKTADATAIWELGLWAVVSAGMLAWLILQKRKVR